MSAYNFLKNAPRRFILVSTHRFLGMKNSKKIKIKNLKAIKCTEIQDGRQANMRISMSAHNFF